MKPQAPCKDCEKRKLLCHSVCPEYKTFKDEVEKFNEVKRKESDKHNSPDRNKKAFKKWRTER